MSLKITQVLYRALAHRTISAIHVSVQSIIEMEGEILMFMRTPPKMSMSTLDAIRNDFSYSNEIGTLSHVSV